MRPRVLRVVVISLLVAIPLLAAQDQSFEVASIKRNNSGDRNSLLRVLPAVEVLVIDSVQRPTED